MNHEPPLPQRRLASADFCKFAGEQNQFAAGFVHSGIRFLSARSNNQRCSRSELVTTETELMAIAAAAIIGLRRPAAATGMATTL